MKKQNNFGEAIIIEQWEGIEINPSILGRKFTCVEGSDIFEYLYNYFHFQDWLDSINNKVFTEEELEWEYTKMKKEQNDKLKELIKTAKPKITITIELENYNQ
jgi:hypothetical protein